MKFRSLLALLAALVLVAAACGDDDDTTAESSDEASTDEGSDQADDESTDEATSDESGDGGDGDFCEFQDGANGLGEAFNGVGDPTADPDELRASFEQGQAFFEDAAADAPEDLQDDLDILSDWYSTLGGILESVDYDFSNLQNDPAAAVEFAESAQEIDPAALTTAITEVTEYFSENCS